MEKASTLGSICLREQALNLLGCRTFRAPADSLDTAFVSKQDIAPPLLQEIFNSTEFIFQGKYSAGFVLSE
jgi:hypothetical protein